MNDTRTTSTPVRLDVRKDGSRFIGDLIWSDGSVWSAWQVSRTLTNLKLNARATFDGEIVRVAS